MADATAAAPASGDEYQFPTTAPTPQFGKVWGFLDGVGGAAQRIGGVVDLVADGAEDVARGRGALDTQRADAADRELSTALRLAAFERGDNKLQIIAIAAAAVAVIMLIK